MYDDMCSWVLHAHACIVLLHIQPPGMHAELWASDVIGGVLWGMGFLLESTADFQKYAFKQDPANRGRFINTGWALDLH